MVLDYLREHGRCFLPCTCVSFIQSDSSLSSCTPFSLICTIFSPEAMLQGRMGQFLVPSFIDFCQNVCYCPRDRLFVVLFSCPVFLILCILYIVSIVFCSLCSNTSASLVFTALSTLVGFLPACFFVFPACTQGEFTSGQQLAGFVTDHFMYRKQSVIRLIETG